MRKHLLFSVMLSLCAMGGMMVYPTPAIATVAQSPAIKVRGQVIDEQGEPLTGATVRIKGGQGGTITDVDGNFQLEVAGNAILSISYVGYKEREVAVRNRAIIEAIQLQPDNQMLEQVVVIGYGTQKKSDLTGSVAVVDTEALKQTSHSISPPCSKVKYQAYKSLPTGSPVPTLPSVSVASDLLVTLLLFMLSMVSPWVLPSAISLQTILKPSKF